MPVNSLAKIEEPRFTIFKPGYEAYGGWSLKAKRLPGTIQLYEYEKEGRTVVELGRLTTRDERLRNLDRVSISSLVPYEKYPNLIDLTNLERVSLGLKPIDPKKAQTIRPRTDPSMKVLSRSQVGDTIEDGVGYGGIRVGSTELELLNKWGGGPIVVEIRKGVFSRYPKKESGSWQESDRGGTRLWGRVHNLSAKWKVFWDLIG